MHLKYEVYHVEEVCFGYDNFPGLWSSLLCAGFRAAASTQGWEWLIRALPSPNWQLKSRKYFWKYFCISFLETFAEYAQFIKQLQLKQIFYSFGCFFTTTWYACDKFSVLLTKLHQNLISFDFAQSSYSLQLPLTNSRHVQPFWMLILLVDTGLSTSNL